MTINSKQIKIFGIILVNLLCLWSLYHMFYGREHSYDYAKKASIDASKITRVETGQGRWDVNDSSFDFYSDYKVALTNRNDIESFCKIIKGSKSKYNDSRPQCW